MRVLIFVAAISAFALQVSTQLSPEEAEQRMAELNNHKATTQTVASKTAKLVPSITGVWQESPTVSLTIIQTKGAFEARSSYTKDGVGEIRWEVHGTITSDGRISGELHHTKAPADWQRYQIREGQLSADGNTISGRARWEWDDDGWQPFAWTRQPNGNASLVAFPPPDPPLHLRDDAPDSLKALATKTQAHRSELIEHAKRAYADAIFDLTLRKRARIVPGQPPQRDGGYNHGEFNIREKDVQWLFPSEDAKQEGIEEGKHLIDRAKRNIDDMATVLVVLPTNDFSDPHDMGVRLNWIGTFQGRVEQVVDDHNLIVEQFINGLPDVWIEGIDTTGMTDNETIGGALNEISPIPIWVNGTKHYDTAIGSTRTILKAEVFDISKFVQK